MKKPTIKNIFNIKNKMPEVVRQAPMMIAVAVAPYALAAAIAIAHSIITDTPIRDALKVEPRQEDSCRERFWPLYPLGPSPYKCD